MQVCAIRSHNSRILVCGIKNAGIAGANNVTLFVPGKGWAAVRNASVVLTAFVNPLVVLKVSPGAVSTIGGGNVTLSGELAAFDGNEAKRKSFHCMNLDSASKAALWDHTVSEAHTKELTCSRNRYFSNDQKAALKALIVFGIVQYLGAQLTKRSNFRVIASPRS